MRINDLRTLATERLAPPVAEFFDQGAGTGTNTAEAVTAWDRMRLRPRMLRDVSSVSTRTRVLGRDVATPICVAPTTLQRMAHPEGELATARATAAAGSIMVVSSNSGTTFEDISATGVPWWIQAYVLRDRGLTTAILRQAVDAGASAVVLTVDTPIVGRKHNVGQSIWELVPDGYLQANFDEDGLADDALDKADDLTPDAIGWLRDVSGLPVVVKGVLRADDARTLVAAGAAAVHVSSHGGRQLDMAVSTAVALPEIVDAVAGNAEVYVDGGIRRAEHVLAALALGADAVFLGRPVLWALAAGAGGTGGSEGVSELLTGLTDDLAHAMMLTGARTIDELTRDLVFGAATA